MPLKCNMRHDKRSKKKGTRIAQSYACRTRAKQWIELLKYATFLWNFRHESEREFNIFSQLHMKRRDRMQATKYFPFFYTLKHVLKDKQTCIKNSNFKTIILWNDLVNGSHCKRTQLILCKYTREQVNHENWKRN